MPIDVFETVEQFDALKENWEWLYAADLAAHVFVSWPWIRAYLPITQRRPLFLCYRRPGATSYCGFLPLAIDGFPAQRPLLNRDLYPIGNPAGDYAGLIAAPMHEREVVEALGDYLGMARWDNLCAYDIRDERMCALVRAFPSGDFRAVPREDTRCPYIPLPPSWDEYLQSRLTKRFRAELRRSMRLVERLAGFDAALIDRHNVEATVELTLRHAQARYRNSPRYRREQQALLLNSFERDCLIGIGLWSGSELVASVLAFTDAHRRELCAYKTTFNIKFADVSPGIAAAGFMIRHAIDQGYEIYDFSRGGEHYKFLFGTLLRYTQHFTVTRLGARSAFGNAVRPFIRAPGRLAEKVLSRVPA